jgi:acyl-CoA thioesterase-1
MIKGIWFFFISFVSLWGLPSQAMQQNILIVGDSLSAAYGIPREASWPQLLRERLQADYPAYGVVNLSLSGETTQGGLQRLPDALRRYQPKIMVLELGANDGLRGFNLITTAENLRQMVQQAQQIGAKVLVLGVRLPLNYGPYYRAKFQEMYAALAAQEKVALVDFFLAGVAENREMMQADGIHPSVAAQPRMLQNVWEGLEPLLAVE